MLKILLMGKKGKLCLVAFFLLANPSNAMPCHCQARPNQTPFWVVTLLLFFSPLFTLWWRSWCWWWWRFAKKRLIPHSYHNDHLHPDRIFFAKKKRCRSQTTRTPLHTTISSSRKNKDVFSTEKIVRYKPCMHILRAKKATLFFILVFSEGLHWLIVSESHIQNKHKA